MEDWRTLYQQKLTTAEEAVKHIKSGDRVVVTHATGEPILLTDAMVANADQYENVEVVHMVAMGKAGAVGAEHLREGQVVVDVGIHVNEEGKLCGDVLWEGLEEKASAATPVPGGVGAVTTAVLAKHLAMAAERKVNR
mgnify:CR=1 FL=1